jgi:hypothetical protein
MSLQHLFSKNLNAQCGCGHPLYRHEDETFGNNVRGEPASACLAPTCACRAFHQPDDQDGGEV